MKSIALTLTFIICLTLSSLSQRAYIGANGDLIVVDIATDNIENTFSLSNNVNGIAVSPDGSKVYAGVFGGSSVLEVNTTTGAIDATIAVGSSPTGVAILPDGSKVYVANLVGNSVSVITTATNSVTTISTGLRPSGVVASKDGATVYVLNELFGNITPVNTSDNSVGSSISVGSLPFGIVLNSDDTRAYVTNQGDGTVSEINLTTGMVVSTFSTRGMLTGGSPRGVAISPDDQTLYVANSSTAELAIIDLNNTSSVTLVAIGASSEPTGVDVTLDGSKVYVTNDNNVSIINTATNVIDNTITGGAPYRAFGDFIPAPVVTNTPDVTLGLTGSPLDEDGGVATVTATLSATSTSDVTVNLTLTGTASSGDYTIPTSITISAGDTDQSISLTGVDDDIVEGNETVIIDISSVTNGNEATEQQVTATITDDDTAGFTLVESGGSSSVSETGTTDDFTLVLDAQPTSNVVLLISSDDTGEATVDQSSVTFTTTDWNVAQTITLTGVDDALVDGDQVSTITVSVDDANSDDSFDMLMDQTVSVTTTDDDGAGFTLVESGGSSSVSETGTTDDFTLVLDAQPTSNVVLLISSDDTGEATVDQSSVTFTTTDWNVAQTITLTGVDDALVDGDQVSTITVSVDDANSDDSFDMLMDQTVSVTTTDDDGAGFTLVESGGGSSVSETGTTDDFTLVLDAQPTSNVVLLISSDDTGEATVDQSSVTFTTTDWNVAQTITLTGVDDALVDGDQVSTITVSVDDANSDDSFDMLMDQTVSVTTTDDDGAGFTLVESGGSSSVSETGTTDDFTLVLDAQPTSNVVLLISSDDTGEATVDQSSVTFTTTDWNVAQTITLTGVDDALVDGDQVSTITVSVDDANSDDSFDMLMDQTVSVTTTDDDGAGFTLVESGGGSSVSETGTTDDFTLVLDAQPTSNVVLLISSDDTGEATVDQSSVTFTTTDWNVAQTITLTGVDDALVDGDQVSTITVSVDDANSDDSFDMLMDQTVSVTTTDDDGAGFTLVESGGSSSVSETGTTDDFTLVLDAQPTSNVVLLISSDDTGEATVDQSSVTFTTTDWNVAQTITLTGVDDALVDGDQVSTITVSVDDANSDDSFDMLMDQTVSVTTTDDDGAGFTLVESGGSSSVSETGTTDDFTLVLDAQPTSNVVLLISSDDTGEATVDQSSVTFTTTDWNVAQTITLTGVDDALVDGDQVSTITVSVDDANSDDSFDMLMDQTVSVTTTDDDGAGFTLVESGGSSSVSETGTTDDFTLVLDAQPTSNVVLLISSDDTGEATVDQSSVTFTTTDWNVAQTITLTGVDDALVDGDQVSTITVSVDDANSDDSFDMLMDQTVSVTTTDDDGAGFTLVESGGSSSVSETGTTDDFTLVLDAQPTSNVVLLISSDDTGEATVDQSSVTFTTTDWNVAQTITLTGVDDALVDGDQVSTITVSVDDANSDDSFDMLMDQTVSVTTTDDDSASPGFTVMESGGSSSVTEAGSMDNVTVVLDSQPASDVILLVSSADIGEVTVDQSSLTFTTTDWNVAQTIVLTGVDDLIDDDDQITIVTFSVDDANSDDDFDMLSDQTINVTTTDDDDRPVVVSGQMFTIDENLSINSVVGTIVATDVNPGTSFTAWQIVSGNISLDGDSDLPFVIDPFSGSIEVNDAGDLDFELGTTTFMLMVTVSDGDNESVPEAVSVTLTDLNDEVPIVTSGQMFSIDEGSAQNVLIGTIVATDRDASTSFQSWTINSGNTSIDGDADLPFSLDPSNGELTVNDPGDLDFSSGTTSFNLMVFVSDGLNVSSLESVIVNVQDVSGGEPTVTITSTESVLTNATPIPLMINFSESVNGFEVGDLTVSGGTIANFSGSGASYSADLVPSGDGNLSVDIAANVAQGDVSSLGNLAASTFNIEFDGTTPLVTLVSTSPSITNSSPILININFSEDVNGFDIGELAVSGATAGNFSGSGAMYTVELTPTGEGVITISVPVNSAEDAAGNGNSASAPLSVEFDQTAPTVTITSSLSSPTQTSPIPITITFSEAVQNFEMGDVTVTGGTISALSGANDIYTANITPSGGGTVTAQIAADVATDIAGNNNEASMLFSIEFTSSPPTVIVFSSIPGPTNTSPVPISIVFSEDVSGFSTSDINIIGGTVGNLSGTGGSYTADVTPSSDGTIVIMIPADVVQGNSGLGNLPSEQFEIDFDASSPTVEITKDNEDPITTDFSITITFSEMVNGFSFNDLNVDNATISNFSGVGSIYKATLTPTNSSDIVISVDAGVASDFAGNLNIAATPLTLVTEVVTSVGDNLNDDIGIWTSNNILNVDLKGRTEEFSAQILNLNGKVIEGFILETNQSTYDLNFSASGIYLIKLESQKEVLVKRFFVK